MATNNAEYWRERFIQLEEATHERGASFLPTVDEQFAKAQKEIQEKIAVWYQRFADNNQVSMAEAQKMLSSSELKELKWDIEEYIKYGKENAVNQQWLKQLENASAKYHITRLQSLNLQMQQSIEKLYGNQLDDIDNLMRDIYEDGYYHTAFEIQKGTSIGKPIAAINDNQLSTIISKPWAADGKNFSDRIWANKGLLISELHTQLTQNCILGKPPDEAIKTIAKRMNVSKGKASNLVMTESAYFGSVAQKDCFKELDVERYELVATLDSHTSPICRRLDGKVFDMNVYEPGVTAPPFHCYCRTVTAPYFDDNEGERAARGADGKTCYVPSDMKYDEWHEKFVESDPKYVAKEKADKNDNSDKKQHEKYKAIFKENFPNSFDKFQNMKYNDSERWNEFKSLKQEKLNSMDFKDMGSLVRNLGDKEVRIWYNHHDKNIPNLIDSTKSIEDQAREAHSLRNLYRTQARELMANQEERKELDKERPNLTFEELIKHKIDDKNLSKEEAIKDIIKSSTTTNKIVNKKFGLED